MKESRSQQGSQVPSDLHQLLLPLGRFQDVSLQSAKPAHGSPGRRRHFPDSSRLFLLPPCRTGNCQTTEMLGKAQQGLLESTASQAPCSASTSTKVLHWKTTCAGHLKLFLHRAQQELGMNNSLGSRTVPTGTKFKQWSKGSGWFGFTGEHQPERRSQSSCPAST